MKSTQVIRIFSVSFCLCLLPSCGLVKGVLKLPGNVLKTVGRTVGVSNLTDAAPQPVKREAADQQVADQIHTGQGPE
jgi:hypothetical protein